MRISTVGYSAKQGVKNIGRNKMFSLASVATMAACIFVFGLFFSIIMNFQYIVHKAEEGVAITVFFNDDATQEQIDNIGAQLKKQDGVKEIKYVSADEAWETFKDQYFGESSDLAEGFKNDNPLAGSDNYEVYMTDVASQKKLVSFAESLDGVRKVNKSDSQYTEQREQAGMVCIGCYHRDSSGSIHFPDQQYGHNGYYCPKGRDCNHEIYRCEGWFCTGTVYH